MSLRTVSYDSPGASSRVFWLLLGAMSAPISSKTLEGVIEEISFKGADNFLLSRKLRKSRKAEEIRAKTIARIPEQIDRNERSFADL